MVKDILIKGNAKMGSEVYIFNLPPKKTCTPTAWCLYGRNGKPACYALRNRYVFPSVISALEERHALSLQEDFVERMSEEIKRKKAIFFRFHSAGDFYSEEYARKVIEISKSCPNTLFRTTTRRRDLTDVLQELNSLPNFIVRESLDNERPKPVMGLPFTALSHMDIVKKEKTYRCLDDCPACDYYCWQHRDNINFDEF
ncbi:hypothetical protein JW756_03680 [Candidatus Woesearchaeota archaeon]|nr:hypothetical protein [Candidatus Woesearchaeota archaeon]